MSVTPGDGAEPAAGLQDICPQATHLMGLLGEPVDEQYLSAFVSSYGESRLRDLTHASKAVPGFKHLSETAAKRKFWELLELLLLEHWISTRPWDVARALGREEPFDKHLIHLRGNIAMALYSQAKSVNWQEPLTFTRGLRVAEAYLRGVVDNRHLLRQRKLPQFQGRLGVSLVLQARYTDLSAAQATEMSEFIRASIEGGNTSVDAYNYLAEALLRVHDATGDANALTELIALEAKVGVTSETLTSHIAEAWFRLSQAASTQQARTKCRQYAVAKCEFLSGSQDPIVTARVAIISAFLETDQVERSLELRGLRTPFGIRTQVRAWRREDQRSTKAVLQRIDHRLSQAPRKMQASPLLRGLIASVRSELADLLRGRSWRGEKISYLSSAVSMRTEGPSQRALKDPESRLQNAIDRFELYRVTQQRSHFVAAIEDILALAAFDQAWPTPLLVLAREVDGLDEGMPLQVAYELRKMDAGGARNVLAHTLAGDTAAIYELAALRALQSREVDRKHLGGRSGVYLAEDYSGIVADTFVFKPTLEALADREAARVAKLEKRLTQMGLDGNYSVPATLARSSLPPDDMLRRDGCEVLVARRFHKGAILTDALSCKDLATRTSVLGAVAKYLAVIHATELEHGALVTGMRRDLLRKDFGRWLRTGMQLADPNSVFDAWWEFFAPSPVALPRRDAHPLNWIIGPDRTVVAVDFEACGWRPAGYELAQLLDDRPLLPLDEPGWKARLHLLHQYRRELARRGVEVDHHHLVAAWEASTVARAVGLLTSPTSDASLRSHGERLLSWIAPRAGNRAVGEMAGSLLNSWSVRRGVAVTSRDQLTPISDARRRHLSRAMAYELRHGESVLLDKGGWAYVAAVSDALNRNGLRTDSMEIRAVAAAIDEPRFELRDKKIRARYGHTREVKIEYEETSSRPTLFHGTATKNLRSIFTEGEGLRSMGRQWVHMSSDPVHALRTAQRHGPGVILALDPTSSCNAVFHAGGTIYLTPAVAASSLRVVSPTELFLASASKGR